MSPAYKCLSVIACLVTSVSSTGCGSAVRVDVPSYFHGSLVVHCTSTGSNEAPLHADTNGVADGPCPPVETGVLVYRDGTLASVLHAPNWTSTHDGIPTSIHIQVD